MSDIELKQCPFCGSRAVILKTDDALPRYIIMCGNPCCPEEAACETGSLKESSLLWNTRPIEDALQAENERLKKELAYLKKEGICDFSSLISNAQRFREALETICAIYEINGAEWRFDKRLYEVAKKALEGKDD